MNKVKIHVSFSQEKLFFKMDDSEMISKGKIIYLNGPSCAGKTTISRLLREKLKEPFLEISIDTFISMIPEKHLKNGNISWLGPKMILSINSCAKTFADDGFNLIVDVVLEKRSHFLAFEKTYRQLSIDNSD